jgi:hypothetical protein
MREDIFKKNMHTQLTTWKKNANIKNLPPPPHHFSNGPSLIKVISTYSMHSCRNHPTINHLLISTTPRMGEGGGEGGYLWE